MARPRIRSSSQLHVFSQWTNLGWRTTRIIDVAEGEAKVRRGEFRQVCDAMTGKVIGYQPMEAPAMPSVDSDPSRAALGRGEMRANAGLMGRSRTARLQEIDKLSRVDKRTGKPLPAEDFVERVEILMRTYLDSANFATLQGRRGDRAVRVYPKGPLGGRV